MKTNRLTSRLSKMRLHNQTHGVDTEEPPQPLDPQKTDSHKKQKYVPKMGTCWVMKKKPIPDIPERRPTVQSSTHVESMRQKDWEYLQEEVMDTKGLSVWKSGVEIGLSQPKTEYMHMRNKGQVEKTRVLNESLKKERNAINFWEEVQADHRLLEQYHSKQFGRTPGRSIGRKNQRLPKSETEGLENDKWFEERTEKPDVLPLWAFFNLPEETSQGLTTTLSKRQLGYNVVKDVVGRPDMVKYSDEVQYASLHSVPNVKNKKGVSHKHSLEEELNKSTLPFDPNFKPDIEKLFVVGTSYEKNQQCIKTNMETVRFASKSQKEKKKKIVRKGTAYNYLHKDDDLRDTDNSPEGMTSCCQLEFGGYQLSYSDDPESLHNEYIIESGSSTAVGENSMSCVFLANTGTTVIHYSWIKLTKDDPLNTCRYLKDPFIFDCWGGTILPSETYKVPVLFKSLSPGYFSEDWKLVTIPVLESGAPIILRMWGIANSKQHDTLFVDRDIIDDTLRKNYPVSMVRSIVNKIIDYLPLDEFMKQDKRFTLECKGPDMFHFLNPRFIYNTASVYRLGQLHNYLKVRQVENTKSQFLTSIKGNQAEAAKSLSRFAEETTSTSEYFYATESSGLQEDEESPRSAATEVLGINTDFSKSFATEIVSNSEVEDSFLKAMKSRKKTGNLLQVIRDMINPDTLASRDIRKTNTTENLVKPPSTDILHTGSNTNTGVQTDPPAHEETPEMKKVTGVDPKIRVDDIRTLILRGVGELGVQEALFEVFAEEVDIICHRPFLASGNWKETVLQTALAAAMDEFSTLAKRQMVACRSAESIYRRRLLLYEGADTTDKGSLSSKDDDEEDTNMSAERALDVPRTFLSISNQQSVNDHLNEIEINEIPRGDIDVPVTIQVLSDERYNNQYLGQITYIMYQLLSDVFDFMDNLSDKEEPATMIYSQETFKKLTKVRRNYDSNVREPPQPPPWLQRSRKLEVIKAENKLKVANHRCGQGYQTVDHSSHDIDRT